MNRKTKSIAFTVAALLALAAGAAYATIPDAQGVIHACYKASGQLRVTDAGSCGSGENALAWNQTGPPGPPGPPAGPALFAVVTKDGTLQSGTAVASARTAVGVYDVQFAEDLTGCAAVVSQGSTDYGGFVQRADGATVRFTPHDVGVLFSTPDGVLGSPVDTGFALIVAC
jgi:hypothetical protein